MYSNNRMFPKEFWGNGPAPGDFYNFTGGYNGNIAAQYPSQYTAPGVFGTQHTSTPITTGTSVLGIKFDGGVMIAADNLVSYGSLARFQNVERVFKINSKTILGAGGDFADFQSLKRSIDQKMVEDLCHQDKIDMKPKSLYNWLTRVLYNRRSRVNPLWLDIVVGGVDNGVPFLGHVDMRGRAYEDNVIATGLGKHLALPLMRENLGLDKKLTQLEAARVLSKSMEVLHYRDCRAMSKFSVAVCTSEEVVIKGPFKVDENWSLAALIKGY